ncbi:uncharacterized protein G2W53_016928 [Senna tora]|uniref:Uncharacterized protein n=1 Tax=Senna tora TaxID=362788 RepID=A0A834TXB1_9FABA|nr:uncharacterized protein G2W53_016928 [Senna tora]
MEGIQDDAEQWLDGDGEGSLWTRSSGKDSIQGEGT